MCTVRCIASASMRFPMCQVLNVPIYPSAEGATERADCMIDHATEGNRPKNSTFHQGNILFQEVDKILKQNFFAKSQ